MRIDVFAVREVEGWDEPTLEPLVTYDLPELDEIAKKDVVVKEGSTKPKLSLNFELSRSQIFKLNGATVSVDEKIIEEVPIKKKSEDKEDSKDESDKKEDSDEAADESGEAADKEEEAEKTEEISQEEEV